MKKLGLNADGINPTVALKAKYPYDYKQKSCRFVVICLKQKRLSTRMGKTEMAMMLTLKFVSRDSDLFQDDEKEWFASFNTCKLLLKGSPN